MTTAAYEHMESLARDMAERCKLCTFCRRECSFLAEHGMPGEMAKRVLAGELDPAVALECHQCGLCTQICPVRGLDPEAFLASMRAAALEADPALKKRFAPLLARERTGNSKAFSLLAVPEGATTLFFPGCELAGSRPDLTWDCFLALRGQDERLGLALHCCGAPSAKLGLVALHEERTAALLERIAATGVREVLVACPQCLAVLKAAEPSFKVRTVYEVLAERIPEAPPGLERIRTGVHDPCAIRKERAVHEAVRTLLWNTGSSVAEMGHSMHKALCCGHACGQTGGQTGGATQGSVDHAQAWRTKRAEEAKDRRVVTYCAACARGLAPEVDAVHLLDLTLQDPEREPVPASAWPGAPQTHRNRIELRQRALAFFAEWA